MVPNVSNRVVSNAGRPVAKKRRITNDAAPVSNASLLRTQSKARQAAVQQMHLNLRAIKEKLKIESPSSLLFQHFWKKPVEPEKKPPSTAEKKPVKPIEQEKKPPCIPVKPETAGLMLPPKTTNIHKRKREETQASELAEKFYGDPDYYNKLYE